MADPAPRQWYVPTLTIAAHALEQGLAFYGEGFSHRFKGDAQAVAASLFGALSRNEERPGLKLFARAVVRVADSGISCPPRVFGSDSGSVLIAGAHAACARCVDELVSAGGLREAENLQGLRPLQSECVAWILTIATAIPTLVCALQSSTEGAEVVVIFPPSRLLRCEQCEPRGSARPFLELVSPFRGPVHGFFTIRSPPSSGRDVRGVVVDRNNFQVVRTSAKATDLDTGTVLAIAEGIERVSFFSDRPDLESTTEISLGDHCVPVAELGGYAPVQYEEGLVHRAPYVPSLPLPWKEATELITGRTKYLLHDCGLRRADIWPSNTSGWAAHVTFERALVNAILELIERDTLLTTWLAGLPGQAADHGHFNQADIADLAARGWSVEYYALQTGVAVPVALVLIVSLGNDFAPRGGTFVGSAAALSQEEAALKAMDDAKQVLGWIEEKRPRPLPTPKTIIDHQFLYLGDDGIKSFEFLRLPSRTPCRPSATVAGAVSSSALDRLLSQLALADFVAYGYEGQVVTNGMLSVARAVIPGLLPIGFGPSHTLRLGGYRERLSRLGCVATSLPLQRPAHPF